jgi:hypothetical protein
MFSHAARESGLVTRTSRSQAAATIPVATRVPSAQASPEDLA